MQEEVYSKSLAFAGTATRYRQWSLDRRRLEITDPAPLTTFKWGKRQHANKRGQSFSFRADVS